MDVNKVSLESSVNDTTKTSNTEDDVVEIEENEVKTDSSKGKRKRRLTSPVWSFFEKLPEKSLDGKIRCKCRYCGFTVNYDSKNGTGNLKRHVQSCVRKDSRDVGQLIVGQNLSMTASKFDPNKFRELLVAAMIMHELLLSFVEFAGIRSLLSYANLSAPIISRNTAKSDVMKMYKREKERIKSMLQVTPGLISLTSDLWTSIATDGYLAITVHFIDNEWVLHKRLLDFSFMPPPHTGVAINEKVCSILAEWELENKIFCVTLDNASANNVFVQLLKDQVSMRQILVCGGEFFHLKCCAHVLNLVVQDGLQAIDCSIIKVRDNIKYVRGSQVRKQKFLECVRLLALSGKKGLRQDVPTRWNSTYLMLESALFYRRAFFHLELSDSNYKSCPTPIEWEKIEKICTFLAVFYDITCVFSGSKYPTANLFFPSVFMAYLTLKEHMISDDEYMKNMAMLMMEKFEKYWSAFSLTLAIAVILDPRYKIDFVDWSYNELYGSNSSQFEEVRSKLFSAFDQYVANNAKNAQRESVERPLIENMDNEDGHTTSRVIRQKFKEFDNFQGKGLNQKTELQQYLEEMRVDRNAPLDVLQFWKANQFRYPDLASMASDILAIPVSTVASESSFSLGGRILDQYRSSLKPETVQALICTKDWLFAEVESVNANDVESNEVIEDIIQMDNIASCSISEHNSMV